MWRAGRHCSLLRTGFRALVPTDFDPSRLRALTLDLDDTLWPIVPTIQRAERVLQDWLQRHAPRTAAMLDLAAMRALREQVALELPELSHDLSALRREAIRRALASAGDDPALAAEAFEVFFAERQRVECFDDVKPALERLASRYTLLALTNGNADLVRIGLDAWFRAGNLGAREVGVAKPDARIFHAACARLGCAPHEVLHVGDDAMMDVAGAQASGLHAGWIERVPAATPAPSPLAWHGRDLLALADHLGV